MIGFFQSRLLARQLIISLKTQTTSQRYLIYLVKKIFDMYFTGYGRSEIMPHTSATDLYCTVQYRQHQNLGPFIYLEFFDV
jgi:hypothetical protein